jgi:hypothetical protein
MPATIPSTTAASVFQPTRFPARRLAVSAIATRPSRTGQATYIQTYAADASPNTSSFSRTAAHRTTIASAIETTKGRTRANRKTNTDEVASGASAQTPAHGTPSARRIT